MSKKFISGLFRPLSKCLSGGGKGIYTIFGGGEETERVHYLGGMGRGEFKINVPIIKDCFCFPNYITLKFILYLVVSNDCIAKL